MVVKVGSSSLDDGLSSFSWMNAVIGWVVGLLQYRAKREEKETLQAVLDYVVQDLKEELLMELLEMMGREKA